MGNRCSQLLESLNGEKEIRILLAGLDAAGKTTVLYRLMQGEPITNTPIKEGFNKATIECSDNRFTMWDLIGQDKARPLWRNFYLGTQGLIFVVDSNDRERITEAREELAKMLNEDELRDAALLVFCNKQDMSNPLDAAEITEKLGLHSLQNRAWYIQATCATSGDGLYEGLGWLSNTIKNNGKKNK